MKSLKTAHTKSIKESWAIISTSGGSIKYYGWLRNDGLDDPVMDSAVFRKRAERAAEDLSAIRYNIHSGGQVEKIYTDKDKFIADYKKLAKSTPKL